VLANSIEIEISVCITQREGLAEQLHYVALLWNDPTVRLGEERKYIERRSQVGGESDTQPKSDGGSTVLSANEVIEKQTAWSEQFTGDGASRFGDAV